MSSRSRALKREAAEAKYHGRATSRALEESRDRMNHATLTALRGTYDAWVLPHVSAADVRITRGTRGLLKLRGTANAVTAANRAHGKRWRAGKVARMRRLSVTVSHIERRAFWVSSIVRDDDGEYRAGHFVTRDVTVIDGVAPRLSKRQRSAILRRQKPRRVRGAFAGLSGSADGAGLDHWS